MRTSNFSDEISLLDGLRNKNPDAYRSAVERYSGRMLATARAIAGAADAEDVVQDAWLVVFRRIDGFEARSTLETWLHRIVVNRAISHIRSRKREQTSAPDTDRHDNWFDDQGSWRDEMPTQWDLDSPENVLNASALQECLDKHFQLLPERQRQVLALRDVEQLPLADICNKLNTSPSNTRVLLHRGRLQIMAMVNEFRESGEC